VHARMPTKINYVANLEVSFIEQKDCAANLVGIALEKTSAGFRLRGQQ